MLTPSLHYAEESNSGSQSNAQDKFVKLFQEVIGPLLLIGMMLSTLSFGSSEHEVRCLQYSSLFFLNCVIHLISSG
jgi:hypothetical protein